MAQPRYCRAPLHSQPRPGQDGRMPGVIAIVIVLVVAIPVSVLLSGGVGAALLGWVLKDEAETAHEGSELIETNI